MSSTAPINSTLYLHDITPQQQQAITRLYEDDCLLIAGKGFGKAMIAHTAAQELLQAGELRRVLVVAPLKVCQLTWATEWRKWHHLQQPALAIGTAADRELALASDNPIVVINFENLPWLFKAGLGWDFDGLVIDEIRKCKAAGGGSVKALRPRLKQFSWRVGMSATPVAECGTDIYAQALLVDAGKALGRSKEQFLRTYFYPIDYHGYNWALLPGADQRLAARLAELVYVADDASYVAELPPIDDDVVMVTLPPHARQHYNDLCTDMELPGIGLEIDSEAQLTGKLTQITAGAVYVMVGAERKTIWLHWAKFDAFADQYRHRAGPVMVAYQYEFELEELRRRYPELVVLGDDPVAAEAAWNRGEIPLLAVHPKSAAHGLNLQYGGHELHVLTTPWGADPWDQLVGRLRRRGQRAARVRRVVYCAVDSIDSVILERHRLKQYDEAIVMAALKRHVAKHRGI